jgi:hypothetical protein
MKGGVKNTNIDNIAPSNNIKIQKCNKKGKAGPPAGIRAAATTGMD